MAGKKRVHNVLTKSAREAIRDNDDLRRQVVKMSGVSEESLYRQLYPEKTPEWLNGYEVVLTLMAHTGLDYEKLFKKLKV